MAMTEEERRKARNEASKRWYAAHKAAKAAQNKAKPAAKKVEAKLAKPKKEKPKKDPKEAIQKAISKIIKAAIKITPALLKIIKGVAPLLGDAYKAGDPKFAKKVAAQLKGLGFSVETSPDGKAQVGWSAFRAFRVPKAPDPADDGAPFVPFPAPGDEKFEEPEKPVEVPVDPAKLEGIEAGAEGPVEIDDPFGPADEGEEDANEGYENEDEEDEDDPFGDEEDDLDGRADMMREIEAQGGYDD